MEETKTINISNFIWDANAYLSHPFDFNVKPTSIHNLDQRYDDETQSTIYFVLSKCVYQLITLWRSFITNFDMLN